MADDLLATLCLATSVPIAVAPAMNQGMWSNPATEDNLRRLATRGVLVWGPDSGLQACGEQGPGRLLEPERLHQLVNDFFVGGDLAGVRVVLTAGPTREPIDPVRYLTNRSSGKMGFALAAAFANRGADVVLVTGPVALATLTGWSGWMWRPHGRWMRLLWAPLLDVAFLWVARRLQIIVRR